MHVCVREIYTDIIQRFTIQAIHTKILRLTLKYTCYYICPGQVVVFARFSGFLHHLRVGSYD